MSAYSPHAPHVAAREPEETVTKSQIREVENARRYIACGMPDTAARTVSALIRAAMRRTDKWELQEFAKAHGLDQRPDFII